MIDFDCAYCSYQFSVPENRAGQRGKCPKCGNIMIVPARSETEFIFSQDELQCADSNMQLLYDAICATLSPQIIHHRILENDSLLFELKTVSGRTQLVIAVKSYDKYLETERLLIWSKVGSITNPESAFVALRVAGAFPHINVSMDEDSLVSVSFITELNESASKLWLDLLLVAMAADALESALFGWDLA